MAELIEKSTSSGDEDFLVPEKGFPPAYLQAKKVHNWGGFFDKIRRSPFNLDLSLASDARLVAYA